VAPTDLLVISREFPPYMLGGMGYHFGHRYSALESLGHGLTVRAGTYRQCTTNRGVATLADADIYRVEYGS
jgi:hypothetical protein